MGLFDSVKRIFSGIIGNSGVTNNITQPIVGRGKNETQTFVFQSIPKTLEELQKLPEASLDTPFKATALTVLALCAFKENEEECFKMLDFLNGPDAITPYTKNFIRDRLKGREYVATSFFKGSSKSNDYTPTQPYTIDVMANPYSFDNENFATLWVQSSGADSPRSIALRKKPSTGEWFFREIQCIGDIKVPDSANPWA